MAYKLLVVKKKIQDDASVSQYNGLKPKVIVEAGPPERMGTWGLNSPQQFLGRLVNPILIGGEQIMLTTQACPPQKVLTFRRLCEENDEFREILRSCIIWTPKLSKS